MIDNVNKMEKNAVKIIMITIVSFILVVLIVGSISFDKKINNEVVSNAEIEWFYDAEDNSTKPITLPAKLDASRNEICTIKGKLPDNCQNINALLFRSSQQAVEVKIDDTVIYSYSTDAIRPFGKASQSKWNLVYFPNDIEGKTVSISIKSPFESFSGNFNHIEVGRGAELLHDVWSQHLPNFITSIVLLIASIAMFISAFCIQKQKIDHKRVMHIGMVAFFASLWLVCESKMTDLLWFNTFTIYQMAFLCLMMIPITFSLFLMTKTNKRCKKCVVGVFLLSVINIILFTILHVFNIYDFFETTIFTHFLIIIEIIMCLVIYIRKIINKSADKYIKMEFLGICILVIATILEMGFFYSADFYNTSLFLNVGLSIFIIILYLSSVMSLIDGEKNTKEYKLKLKEAKNYLMLSQMKPHFIYNTLGAIRTMIISSPQTAYDMTTNFSKYLRANITTINPSEQILFEKELEHIRAYVEIEKVRFKGRINIIYNIKRYDFLVPPLTIQPLVENAIKHGICKKSEGGTVRISALEGNDGYVVIVEDNGVGFDPQILDSKEKEKSIGIKNIQFRLKEIANATMLIESSVEKGTKVVVTFKKEAHNEYDYS